MAKAKASTKETLLDLARQQPAAKDMRGPASWGDKLKASDSKLYTQLLETVDSFWRGELSDQFPTPTSIARWLAEKLPGGASAGTVIRFINERKQ